MLVNGETRGVYRVSLEGRWYWSLLLNDFDRCNHIACAPLFWNRAHACKEGSSRHQVNAYEMHIRNGIGTLGGALKRALPCLNDGDVVSFAFFGVQLQTNGCPREVTHRKVVKYRIDTRRRLR